MAIALFSVLYISIIPMDSVQSSTSSNIIGYIQDGSIILEHHGGSSVTTESYLRFNIGGNMSIVNISSTFLHDTNNNSNWDIGEKIVYSAEIGGLQVETFVINEPSNSVIFSATLQQGSKTSQQSGNINTSVNSINPYVITTSPFTIDASSTGLTPSNVTLWYQYSTDNSTWGSESTWWSNSWSKRKPINLHTISGVTLTNYQIQINITYDDDMKTDFSDLRFINYTDNTTQLDYWIESKSDGNWAKVWIKNSNSITTTDRTHIWIYYDNQNEKTKSDPDNTFDTYINFTRDGVNSYGGNGQDGDPTQWEIINDTTLRMYGNNWKSTLKNLNIIGNGSQAISFSFKSIATQGEINGVGLDTDNSISSNRFYRIHGTQSWGRSDHYGYTGNDNWQDYNLILDDYNGNFDRFVFTNDADAGQNTNIYYKNIRIRKYHTSEIISTFGIEQSNNVDVNWTKYGIDTVFQWQWDFNFPDGQGYYQFYSIGKKSGLSDETQPLTADAICKYTNNTTTSTTNISIRVGSGNDDAEERLSTGYMSLSSSDLEFVRDGNDQEIGIRFNSIEIPQGSTISSANLTFVIDEKYTQETNLNIFAHDTDNSPTFTNTDYNITGREKTSNSVQWNSLLSPDVGETLISPNIKTVIQEIINRQGWSSGNSITIIINGSGLRTVESYNGDSQKAPLLRIRYIITETQEEKKRISQWKLDENSGSTAFDSIGDNGGTIHGAKWAAGVDGSALNFDGDNDYIEIPNNESLQPGDNLTMMAWVKWGCTPSEGDSWANIINKHGDKGYQLQHDKKNSYFEFSLQTDKGRKYIQASKIQVKDGIWYHITCVYNKSASRMYIFVNGSLENYAYHSGSIVETSTPLNIGRRGQHNDRYFNGSIDEVRFYNSVLSESEIQTIYNEEKP